MFWNSERFSLDGPKVVSPFDAQQVVNCSYELTLGPEGFVTSDGRKQNLMSGTELVIPPGQFALLLTEEMVTIPPDVIGFISVRSSFKLHGLVNVSGFHVDPGFSGRLIFSVYNAGGSDVHVSRGDRLFLLWLASLEAATRNLYQGSRQGQTTIPNRDVMAIGRQHYSPAMVHQRLQAVELRTKTIERIAAGVVIGLIVAMATFFGQALLRDQGGGTTTIPTQPVTTTAVTPTP